MRKIDVIEVFNRLCKIEYNLLKYINREQGEASAPLNLCNAAEAIRENKTDVRKAVRRLVEAGILQVDGGDFKINSEIFKK